MHRSENIRAIKYAVLIWTSLVPIFTIDRALFAAPREVYTDPETGYEVWRLTDDPRSDRTFYYTNPGYSPNGRYIVFYSRHWPLHRIHIMDADGSNRRGLGDWSDVDDDVWEDQADGAWSKDSRYYYACGNLFYVEVDTNDVNQLSPDANFYWPFLSPDGRTLCGVSVGQDSEDGGTVKFINTDGTGYKEFDMPYNQGGWLDVSHGWLGNEHIWYSTICEPCPDVDPNRRTMLPVMSASDGNLAGFLDVLNPADPRWEGKFGHSTFSPESFAIGNGAGLISGHGRTFAFANTKYWSQDREEREIRPIVDRNMYPDFGNPIGTHSNFSPDGKWLVLENVHSDLGKMAVFPVDGQSSPIWLVRFRDSNEYTGDSIRTQSL